jgi:uncharacterized protein
MAVRAHAGVLYGLLMPWTCPSCRETVDDGLDACWNCGSAADGTLDPDFEHRKLEVQQGPAHAELLSRYTCPKCGSRDGSASSIRATESLLGALVNWQSAEFTAVTCTKCTFTEFYRCAPDQLGNLADLIFGR